MDIISGSAYKELFGNVHASPEFRNRIMSLSEKKLRKPRPVVKVAAALAAAVIVGTLCAMMVSASRTEFATIVIDGEKQKARYVDFGTGTYLIECEKDNNEYSAYISGDYDKERDILYFKDLGDYFIASTEEEPSLNLYTDIDKSQYAEFKEEDGSKILCVRDNAGVNEIVFDADEKDGEADGVIMVGEGSKEAYTLLPNGSVVNTIKLSNISLLKMFGYNSDRFFNDLYEMLDGFRS